MSNRCTCITTPYHCKAHPPKDGRSPLPELGATDRPSLSKLPVGPDPDRLDFRTTRAADRAERWGDLPEVCSHVSTQLKSLESIWKDRQPLLSSTLGDLALVLEIACLRVAHTRLGEQLTGSVEELQQAEIEDRIARVAPEEMAELRRTHPPGHVAVRISGELEHALGTRNGAGESEEVERFDSMTGGFQ